jgi:hypothetical protein
MTSGADQGLRAFDRCGCACAGVSRRMRASSCRTASAYVVVGSSHSGADVTAAPVLTDTSRRSAALECASAASGSSAASSAASAASRCCSSVWRYRSAYVSSDAVSFFSAC